MIVDLCGHLPYYFGVFVSLFDFTTVGRVTKSYLYNFDPLKPHFYIVKLGFTGEYTLFFLFLLKT